MLPPLPGALTQSNLTTQEIGMPQARAPLKVIYACGFFTAAIVLALMAYAGMFDGGWDAFIDILKDMAKYFSQ